MSKVWVLVAALALSGCDGFNHERAADVRERAYLQCVAGLSERTIEVLKFCDQRSKEIADEVRKTQPGTPDSKP